MPHVVVKKRTRCVLDGGRVVVRTRQRWVFDGGHVAVMTRTRTVLDCRHGVVKKRTLETRGGATPATLGSDRQLVKRRDGQCQFVQRLKFLDALGLLNRFQK